MTLQATGCPALCTIVYVLSSAHSISLYTCVSHYYYVWYLSLTFLHHDTYRSTYYTMYSSRVTTLRTTLRNTKYELLYKLHTLRPIPTDPQLIHNFPTNGFPQLFSLQNYPMKSLMVKAVVAQKEVLSEWILFCSTTFFCKPFHKRKGMLFFIINSS